MESCKNYDVIVVGAGPAGLSVGAELSKELQVLVIEKEIAGETTKSWLVPYDIAMKNSDVIPYTYGGITNWSTDTFTGAKIKWDVRLFERFPYIKEKEILKYWIEVIRNNNSAVLDNCNYLDHQEEDNLIKVRTSRGNFSSKLLIDASGSDSLILQKYELTKEEDLYWWSVYGCLVEHPEGIASSMRVGEYRFWQTFEDTNVNREASLREGRPVFEYEVFNENSSFPLILYLRKNKVSMDFMEEEFMRLIANEETTKEFRDVKIIEKKYGWFPSGGLSQKISQDRVAFIGDAGCWTTPCGWGMAFILENYKSYAHNLVKLCKEDRLDKDSLDSLVNFELHEKHQILFDKIIIRFLANASASQLDKFINFFTIIDPLISEKIFTLKVTHSEIKDVLTLFMEHFSPRELLKLFPGVDFWLIIKELNYLLGDIINEELFKEHDVDGFDFEVEGG